MQRRYPAGFTRDILHSELFTVKRQPDGSYNGVY
jgi:hypothetical protein